MGFWWQPKPVGGPAGNTYCLLYEEVELSSSWSSSSSSSVWAGTFWGVLNVSLYISENHDYHYYFWNQHQYQCQVDEGNVEIVRILGFSSTTPDLRPDVEEFRYPRFFSPQRRAFQLSWSLSQGWHPKCYVHITDAKVHSVQQTGGTSISLCLVGAALTRTYPGCGCGELWPENLPDHLVPLAGIHRQGRLDRRWHPYLGPGWSSATDISHV